MNKSLSLFDLIPGKLLAERYEIIESFRKGGGMYASFLVLDKEQDAQRVVQVLPSAMLEDGNQSDDFIKTMLNWKDVKHPAVSMTHDVLDLGGGILIVTDVPQGESLREVLNDRGSMSEAGVLRVGIQMLGGVAAIHAAGLVHGDIKPYTIYAAGEGEDVQVQLLDGGITPGLWRAKDLGDKTALIGTPLYAPVEQFGGDSPDVQSDVYNVATVLYELCCGVVPWHGKSFLEVFQSKLEKTAPPMSARAPEVEVSRELEVAIAGGLMADRSQRYATADEFRLRLEAVQGH